MNEFVIYQYVIYEKPRDYPDKWIVRQWRITAGDAKPGAAVTADSLEEARGYVPPGLVQVARLPDDDPAIVEVWT